MAIINTYVTRGSILESVHRSKCIIKDYNYKTIFSTKNDNEFIYPRSAIKIFQAIPLIKSNAHNKFNLSRKQISISCSSHCGEHYHLRILTEWIDKLGINIKQLKCGIHNPLNLKSANQLLLSGEKPNQLHNNCSGKHLAMITGCMASNMKIRNYIEFDHPYQKEIRKCLEYFTQDKIRKNQRGVDGCSAPQYAFKLKDLSNSMIGMLKNYKEKNLYSKEVKILLKSILKYPELTGSKSIYPSQLISKTNGKMFCKGGAEGVLLFAHIEKKIGGVIKVSDGNERALPSIANEIFKKLNILDAKELKSLSEWTNQKILNHDKKIVGSIYTKI